MWDIAKTFEVVHDAPHNVSRFEVIRPYWAHRKDDRRQAKILMAGEPFYGGMSIVEAERVYAALGNAIELAKTLKLEKPKEAKPRLVLCEEAGSRTRCGWIGFWVLS